MIIKRSSMGGEGIDTTVKSSVGTFTEFAPEWSWVMDHKKGKISDLEYTMLFIPKLHTTAFQGWRDLYGAGKDGEVTIKCYCSDGVFCHTLLIALYAELRWPHKFQDHTRSRHILKQEVIEYIETFLKS